MGRHFEATDAVCEFHVVRANGRQMRVIQNRMSIIRDVHGIDIEWEPLDSTTLWFSVTGGHHARQFAIDYLRRISSF